MHQLGLAVLPDLILDAATGAGPVEAVRAVDAVFGFFGFVVVAVAGWHIGTSKQPSKDVLFVKTFVKSCRHAKESNKYSRNCMSSNRKEEFYVEITLGR
jgi:hypothetical protein